MDVLFSYKVELLLFGCFTLLLSIVAHIFQKEKLSLLLLLSAGAFLFLSAAVLFPFLNIWDERFHALVAKNLMQHPLMPTLYDQPIVNMVYTDDWARFHIWLHKQPLFMWQMALSYKLFGVSELAARLPSVVLACFTVFGGYRSGKILGNKNIAYYTAFLLVTSFYLKELVAGWQMTDHNDLSFLAYISLSIWAWLEYIHSGKRKWIILVGVFSGCAILCKWIVGLLVYLCWGIYSIKENKLQIKKYKDIALALLITVVVFLPWQILIFSWYPNEAKAEYLYNIKHFTQPMEGHEGPLLFHLTKINELYGSLVLYLIIPALVIFYRNVKNKIAGLALIASVLFIYLFFTLVQTKMASFTIIAILPIFVSLAFLIDFFISLIMTKLNLSSVPIKALTFLFLITLAYLRIDIKTLSEKHSLFGNDNSYFTRLKSNKAAFKRLHLPDNAILFNVAGKHYVEAMFYTGFPAYHIIPSQEQYLDLKRKNKIIALYNPKDGNIPSYLSEDKTLIILRDTIQECE